MDAGSKIGVYSSRIDVMARLLWFDAVCWMTWRIFFFHSTLRWSVAVSTVRRQSSRVAAFLHPGRRKANIQLA